MSEKQHRKEFLTDLRSMKAEERTTRERDVTEELFWLRFKHRGGQVEKPTNIKHVRRNLARIKTIANEKAKSEEGQS